MQIVKNYMILYEISIQLKSFLLYNVHLAKIWQLDRISVHKILSLNGKNFSFTVITDLKCGRSTNRISCKLLIRRDLRTLVHRVAGSSLSESS